jgi:hypothetical protein
LREYCQEPKISAAIKVYPAYLEPLNGGIVVDRSADQFCGRFGPDVRFLSQNQSTASLEFNPLIHDDLRINRHQDYAYLEHFIDVFEPGANTEEFNCGGRASFLGSLKSWNKFVNFVNGISS